MKIDMAAIAGDDETYPVDFAEGSVQFYEEVLEEEIAKVHELAARKGIPIVTFVVPEAREMAAVVTIKSMLKVPCPILTAVLLAGGEHPRVSAMLAAAVYASQDNLLRVKYLEMLAEAFNIPGWMEMTPPELANAVSSVVENPPPSGNNTIQDDVPSLNDSN